jgi:hypothetical protein
MQAEGKKRMKALGKVEVPQEAFMAGKQPSLCGAVHRQHQATL